MLPHICGNPFHDVPMLLLWVLNFAPDRVPAIGFAREKLRARHHAVRS